MEDSEKLKETEREKPDVILSQECRSLEDAREQQSAVELRLTAAPNCHMHNQGRYRTQLEKQFPKQYVLRL